MVHRYCLCSCDQLPRSFPGRNKFQFLFCIASGHATATLGEIFGHLFWSVASAHAVVADRVPDTQQQQQADAHLSVASSCFMCCRGTCLHLYTPCCMICWPTCKNKSLERKVFQLASVLSRLWHAAVTLSKLFGQCLFSGFFACYSQPGKENPIFWYLASCTLPSLSVIIVSLFGTVITFQCHVVSFRVWGLICVFPTYCTCGLSSPSCRLGNFPALNQCDIVSSARAVGKFFSSVLDRGYALILSHIVCIYDTYTVHTYVCTCHKKIGRGFSVHI